MRRANIQLIAKLDVIIELYESLDVLQILRVLAYNEFTQNTTHGKEPDCLSVSTNGGSDPERRSL